MVSDAVVRVFIDHGDRTDRNKARLKYVIEKMGVEKFLALVEEKLGRKLHRAIAGPWRRDLHAPVPLISAFIRRSRNA